jgi:hypothetical protein
VNQKVREQENTGWRKEERRHNKQSKSSKTTKCVKVIDFLRFRHQQKQWEWNGVNSSCFSRTAVRSPHWSTRRHLIPRG